MVFSSRGTLASGSIDGTIKIWNAINPAGLFQVTQTFFSGHNYKNTSGVHTFDSTLAFSSDGTLASGSDRGRIEIFKQLFENYELEKVFLVRLLETRGAVIFFDKSGEERKHLIAILRELAPKAQKALAQRYNIPSVIMDKL